MTFVSRLIREPLVHFILIGALVFGTYALIGKNADELRDRIVVTEGRVQQIAQVFAKTWQRPPTPEELRGLVDAYIKEEVYYREALKLGLDRDDTLIRRRMQQKMEFVTEPSGELLVADDAKQNHETHHREIERGGDAEKIDQILQHLKQRNANQYTYDGSFAAPQAATAQNGGRDAVQFKKIAVRRRRN